MECLVRFRAFLLAGAGDANQSINSIAPHFIWLAFLLCVSCFFCPLSEVSTPAAVLFRFPYHLVKRSSWLRWRINLRPSIDTTFLFLSSSLCEYFVDQQDTPKCGVELWRPTPFHRERLREKEESDRDKCKLETATCWPSTKLKDREAEKGVRVGEFQGRWRNYAPGTS